MGVCLKEVPAFKILVRESDGWLCCKLRFLLQSQPGKERASEKLSALDSCTETSQCWIIGAILNGENENNTEPCVFKQYLLNLLKCRWYQICLINWVLSMVSFGVE